jgi:hypothetical protein
LGCGCRGDFGDLVVGHARQASQHVFEVSVGIDAPPAATFDDSVNDGSAFSGIGIAHEEPVLFSKSGWTNSIFQEVVVDSHIEAIIYRTLRKWRSIPLPSILRLLVPIFATTKLNEHHSSPPSHRFPFPPSKS